MRFLSTCSGIEAATLAWSCLGWRPWALAEVDPFPAHVLHHHYGVGRPHFMPRPDEDGLTLEQRVDRETAIARVERLPRRELRDGPVNFGDMNTYRDWPDATIDLLCGGTPCQSFSNAGLRAGLDDPRGQLMLTFGAVAARYRPRWLVWENVPGVLSSDGGRDFGTFLGLLGFLGYGFAYRVLDAQFVRVDGYGRAVPQRRRRVFVVGCLGDWRRAAAVLLEREGLRGDPAPRRGAGARVAAALTSGADGRGRAGGGSGRRQEDDFNIIGDVAGAVTAGLGGGRSGGPRGADDNAAQAHHLVAETASLLAHSGRSGHRLGADEAAGDQLIAFGGNDTRGPIEVSTALRAKGGSGHMDFESETFLAVAPTITAEFGDQTGQDARNALLVAMHAGSRVRRLTPLECERLQGIPDNYTRVAWRHYAAEDCPDGPRYKAIGNSWAVNSARWLGRRIALVEQIPTT